MLPQQVSVMMVPAVFKPAKFLIMPVVVVSYSLFTVKQLRCKVCF